MLVWYKTWLFKPHTKNQEALLVMGSIQSMLAIGAVVLFSLISIRFNSTVLQNMTVEVENKVYLTAFSLADDLIEEIKQKAFDEKTVDFQAIAVGQLSSTLGPDGGEVWPNFNDVDDYNGYKKPVALPHAEGYEVSCKVSYVNSDGTPSGKSFYKKVEVQVASEYLSSPLYISFIFSLHSKN